MRIYRIATWKDHDWSQVNWGNGDSVIAEQMNVSMGTVNWARKNIAPDEYYNLADSIDWIKSDEQISQETGWSIVAVRRKRKINDKKYDKPLSGYQPTGGSFWDSQLDELFMGKDVDL